MSNTYLNELGKVDMGERFTILFSNLKRPFVELWYGIRKGTLKLLKANRCKDIGDYFKLPKEKRVPVSTDEEDIAKEPNRHIIIVDEAAELFLASDKTAASDVQKARRILSRVSRQGRSIGVHLLLATQRPDGRALDPQIKANLTGVLCFQMVNDSSSILVLGNGRATDLPAIPGRAIWKTGMEMVEVQTPLLEWTEAEELLRTHYREKAATAPELNLPNSNVVPDRTSGTMERV